MRHLATLFGAVFLFLIGAAVCTVLALFVVGAWLLTYPLLRLSPRDRRLRATLDLLAALAGAAAAYKADASPPADGGT